MSIRITFMKWVPLGIAITGAIGFGYLAVQQEYRSSLNDPQIQIVRDAADALERGAQPAEVVPRYIFDISKSLSTFIAVYDSAYKPLESSVVISGAPPQPPVGVFEAAKEMGENRLTWQPDEATRIALVMRPVGGSNGYFVASGRNMSEVESRIDKLGEMTLLVWLGLIVSTLSLEFFGAWRHARAMKAQQAHAQQ